MKNLVLGILCLSLMGLTACNSDPSQDPGGRDPNPTRPKKEDIQGNRGIFEFDASTELEEPNSPYGLWESNTVSGEGRITFTIRQQIEENRITAAVLCSFPSAGAIVAQTDATGEVKNNKILIYENKSANASIRGDNGQIYNCSSTLSVQDEANAPAFTITDGIMKMDDGTNFVLTKIGN